MGQAASEVAGLVIDPVLSTAWEAVVPATRLLGLAGATAGSHGTVVAVSDTAPDDATLAAVTPRLAAALGVRSLELVTVPGGSLADLVREWVYQAAQGSGRGVHLKVAIEPGGSEAPGAVRVLVRAIDSSARELASRLASPQEPALPALRAVLGGRPVTVEDEESAPA